MKGQIKFVHILTSAMLLLMMVAPIVYQPAFAQSTEPSNVTLKLWLLTKSNGETEVNHYLHWTETASRDYIDIVCDCKAEDIGYADMYQNDNWDNPAGMSAENLGDISQVFHRVRLHFPYSTSSGTVYQAEIGYGSYQDNWYAGYDDQGRAIFEWTYNPWPFPVNYQVHWVAQSMPPQAADNNGLILSGNWDSFEQETPPDYFNSAGFGLYMTRSAAANEPIVVRMAVPGQYFNKNTFNNTTAPNVQTENQPSTQSQSQPTPMPITKKSGMGALGVICIIGLVLLVSGGLLFWLFNRKPKRRDIGRNIDSTPPSTCYAKPVVRREGKRYSSPTGVATDLTMAQVAALIGASDEKIVLAAVQDLKSRELVTIISEDPLKLSKRLRKVAAADETGELTSVDQTVLTAIADDGQINSAEEALIVAAVKASLESKLEVGKDRTATRDYYEERIRALEQQVRRQSNPTVYVERNNDIWFWLWLSDRYDHNHHPASDTYVYPTPSTSVYKSPTAGRQPVSNDSFRQSVADFEEPKTGIAAEITNAAKRAADQITGAAAGGHDKAAPAPRPHDACYTAPHDACVTRPKPHDKAHDACVKHDKHDNCYTRPHDACVQHSKHDNCYSHSNCHTHSACHSHSACVSHSAGGGGRPH